MGRPKLEPHQKMRRVVVYLPFQVASCLTGAAERKGTSESTLVRSWVCEKLEINEKGERLSDGRLWLEPVGGWDGGSGGA